MSAVNPFFHVSSFFHAVKSFGRFKGLCPLNLDVVREVALFDVFPQPTESGLYCDRLCGVGIVGFVTRAVVADGDDDLFVHGRISFWW